MNRIRSGAFAVLSAFVVFAGLSCSDDNTAAPEQPASETSSLLERYKWYPASPPLAPNADYPAGAITVVREPLRWYNIEPDRGARRRDFNPEIPEQEDGIVSTFDVEVDAVPSGAQPWCGVMRGFGTQGWDLSNATTLDIWVNDFKPDPGDRGGVLYIELGVMDEDFYEPAADEFNDEDKNRDGFAAAFDDTGLDGLFNKDEPDLTGDREDPAGDDLDLRRINGVYRKCNGTEANHAYDTEDLDRSGTLDQVNGFFRYRIDLAGASDADIRADYPDYDGFNDAGHENDAWRHYRIDLSDYEAVTPDGIVPQFHHIHHLRIWFNRMDEVLDPYARRIQVARLQPSSKALASATPRE